MEIKKALKKFKTKVSAIFQLNTSLSLKEARRLSKMVRYVPTTLTFYKKKIKIVDSLTFLSSYYEIFKNNIYQFPKGKGNCTIIDCGANIGLSTIYFKMNYPESTIVAFEPDPHIFEVLKDNISAFGYKSVTCKNEAVSNKDNVLDFRLEGGHSGMIVNNGDLTNTVKIKAIRLKTFLGTYPHITFLKIDIEGEEVNLIPDIADQLSKVDYLFLEYHSFIDKDQHLDQLLNNIRAAGMRYYIKEASNKNLPFFGGELFLKMDMLVNIFCYRQ